VARWNQKMLTESTIPHLRKGKSAFEESGGMPQVSALANQMRVDAIQRREKRWENRYHFYRRRRRFFGGRGKRSCDRDPHRMKSKKPSAEKKIKNRLAKTSVLR